MDTTRGLIAGIGVATGGRRSRWPARLDVLQSTTGLALALFMWGHMLFVSSILVSTDAFWAVARFFEGYFFFGRSFPWIVSLIVAAVFAILVAHALLAMRKFPASYNQYRLLSGHVASMRHGDTTLWAWQVATGFALFFMASIHLYIMMMRPERIGPFESADRVWSETMWPLYLVMLFVVEIHAGIGLYRLAVKWGWFGGRNPESVRRRLKLAKWIMTAFFLLLGLLSLAAYVKIGIDHADRYGEPYTPTWQRSR